MFNNSYDRKIAQKLKKIDKEYVADEDKKELVGGNVRELVDVKDGMGLQGMGLSAGMKKMIKKEAKKGKGMSAGAQLGYDGPPVWKDNITPPFFVATGGGNASRFVEPLGSGMSAGGFLDLLKLPFKLLGKGKNGKRVVLKGAGLMDLFDPVKLIKFGRMALGDSEEGSGIGSTVKNLAMTALGPFAIPLKLMGLGKDNKYYEMEGCGVITDTIQKLLQQLNPLHHISSAVSESWNKGKKYGKRYQGNGMSAGADNRTGNQGLMGYGKKKGKGMSAGKKAPKDGAGIVSILSDIASLPSKIIPNTFTSPLEDIFGRERGRNVSKSIVENMMDGKGMGARPTKQNMPSSSFSGGAKKKGIKRVDIVKRIMKERGVSMIEASKIVKNEGLY